MRYMMMVKADPNSESGRKYEDGAPPNPKLMEAIGKYAQEMFKAGVLLDTGGLLPSSKGARIRAVLGKLTVIDGPFIETKELIGGYGILRADSREEAIEMGRAFMQLHVDVLGPSYQGELEIREMSDPPDSA